jgi:hypothetical protein
LDAAIAKIAEYYQKTADSDAFIFAMGKVFLSTLFIYSFDGLIFSSGSFDETEAFSEVLGLGIM